MSLSGSLGDQREASALQCFCKMQSGLIGYCQECNTVYPAAYNQSSANTAHRFDTGLLTMRFAHSFEQLLVLGPESFQRRVALQLEQDLQGYSFCGAGSAFEGLPLLQANVLLLMPAHLLKVLLQCIVRSIPSSAIDGFLIVRGVSHADSQLLQRLESNSGPLPHSNCCLHGRIMSSSLQGTCQPVPDGKRQHLVDRCIPQLNADAGI